MSAIKQIEEYFGCSLPASYKTFLEGHTAEFMNDLVVLYQAHQVIEMNETYQTKEYAPGYINIGDDSGGRAFLLKFGEDDPSVNVVGHGSMDSEYMEFVANKFSEWIKSDCEYSFD